MKEADDESYVGPVGYPLAIRPEHGPSIERFYTEKHSRGEMAKYFLHQTLIPSRHRG